MRFVFQILFFVFQFSILSSEVFGQPFITILQRDSGCVGTVFNFDAIVFSPNDSVVQYTWDFGDGTSPVISGTSSQSHLYSSAGIFDVSLSVVTLNGNSATQTEPGFIRTGNAPQATIDESPQSLCFGESFQFTDTTPAPVTGWFWQFGDGNISFEKNPVHQYNIDTSGALDPFDVVLTAYHNGCPDNDTAVNMISVLGPIPIFDFTYDCNAQFSVNFQNLSTGMNQYLWDMGDSIGTFSSNFNYTFPVSGTYNVTLTATNQNTNCIVDTTLQVQVNDLFTAGIYEIGEVIYAIPQGLTYSYTWYMDTIEIDSCDTDSCNVYQFGMYYVIVTDIITGCSDTSGFHFFSPGIFENNQDDKIQIYPNPIHGNKLFFRIKDHYRINQIRILDSYGRLIYKSNGIEANPNGIEINLQRIPSGLYFMEFETGDGVYGKKFLFID